MNTMYGVIALAGVLRFVTPGGNAGAHAIQCGPANDTSAALLTDLKGWMTTENPNKVVLRDRVFRIPVVAESELSLVSDEKICRKVVEAYERLPEFAYTPARVYVIKLGASGYVSYDPDKKGGEFVSVHIFDRDYAHSGGWSF